MDFGPHEATFYKGHQYVFIQQGRAALRLEFKPIDC